MKKGTRKRFIICHLSVVASVIFLIVTSQQIFNSKLTIMPTNVEGNQVYTAAEIISEKDEPDDDENQIPVIPARSEEEDDKNEPIVVAEASGFTNEEIIFSYSSEDSESDPICEIDKSYTSPEDEEPDPNYEIDAYAEAFSTEPEAMDGDEEIGPPIAPPNYYIEAEDVIAPVLPDNFIPEGEPLAEEADPPIDITIEIESAEIG